MKKALFLLIAISFCSLEAKKTDSPPPPEKQEWDADLFKKNDQVFSEHVEFLYWQVLEGALDYALKMQHSAWGPSNSFAQGKFETSTFKGDPGFRLKASFFRATRFWELWWQYTRMTASGKNGVSRPSPSEFVTGTWPQVFTGPVERATSELHLNYNTAEMLVDRFFNPNPHLRLRLIGGALVAWMDQLWKIEYHDPNTSFTKIQNRWKYIGGGFRVGTMVDWYWCYDIYITALATTGATIGTYENKAKQSTNVILQAGDDPSVRLRDTNYSDVRPAVTVQALLGPSWQKSFKSTRIEVFAGYEVNSWFNLQEVYRSSAGSASAAKESWINYGLVTLQGLTTRLTVDY